MKAEGQIEKVVAINKKYEKRENARESKAEIAAQIEKSIEKELLNRLKQGTYQKEINNIDQSVFLKTMEEQEVVEELDDREFKADSDADDYGSEMEE